MRYFSTFSGIGGFELAMPKKYKCVGYSEIDKYAIEIYQKHFPNHKNFGDITKIDIQKLPDFDLLIGGSPCQDLSVSKMNREGLLGEKSKLFFKFLEILKIKKPKYFLLENVASMSKDNQKAISEYLGVEPVMINAALVSAQQRKRLFWCNWKVKQPEDRNIFLKDILESGFTEREKSLVVTATYSGANPKDYFLKSNRQLIFKKPVRVGKIGKGGQGNRIYSIDGKSVCLSANGGGRGAKTGLYLVNGCASRTFPRVKQEGVERGKRLETRKDGKANCLTTVQTDSMAIIKNYVRKLSPVECERLQCFPDDWTFGISNTQRYKCLGNAVNVEVVKHIIKQLKTTNDLLNDFSGEIIC